jgi:glycerophosphoryl diester phosphodiesterase
MPEGPENVEGAARPLVIAHRGSSNAAPENTHAAFARAVSDGADLIEFDIRMSRDGVLVVFHDRRLVRTTDGSGRVRDLPLSALRPLDAGAWFGRQFAGERIPTLEEVLESVPLRVGLNVEVKTDGDRRRNDAVAGELVRQLRARGGARRVLVSSFDHGVLRTLHTIAPDLPLGVLYTAVRDFGTPPSVLCRRAGATVFICSRSQLRRRHCAEARSRGTAVLVYGVDRPEQLRHVLRMGVDGVITNTPHEIRRMLEEGVAQ